MTDKRQSNPRIHYQFAPDRTRLAPIPGKPLMVHVVVNVEYWPFDQPMPRTIMPAPHGKSPVPDVPNFSWVEYGMRVGLPRLMRVLAEGGVRASTTMNASCTDVYPAAAEAMRAADWEFIGHGWLQRSLQFEENEEEVIARSLSRLETLTGKRIRGWMGPGLAESFNTPDLLKKHGVEYVADWFVDDLPCWMYTKHGPLVAIPYTMELNDVPIWAVEKHSSDEMLKRLKATLGVFEQELEHNPKVLTIALHPHLIGVAHRAWSLAEMIDLLRARNDTVFVTGSEIADWFVKADGTGGAEVA
ncbi:MAG: polysaccharide deacetylase family protein [Rhizobiales bacterium]|nr:polysaccharide deacetylase family protein [Hyphomicrobiales bacterium]